MNGGTGPISRSSLSNSRKTQLFDSLDQMRTRIVAPSDLADWLLGRGQHFVTTSEVADLLGISAASVPSSLQRSRDSHRIVSVTKGGWVPVPPEYRASGAPPPLHFVDSLMRHLDHSYYVGFLSAAAQYGASHQVPMELQIVTPALLRTRTIGEGRIRFIRRGATERRASRSINVATGRVTVSSPETTVLDIVEAPRHAAGLANVATIVGELLIGGRIDADLLAAGAAGYPITVIQRTGYLLSYMAAEVDIEVGLGALAGLVSAVDYTVLDPESSNEGHRDSTWKTVINTPIEHDL